MSQKNFQIFRSQISDLKTDNVDYLKKPPWKKFFFDIFAIHLTSRYEKRCQMLQRLFSLFQGSKNQLCISIVYYIFQDSKILAVYSTFDPFLADLIKTQVFANCWFSNKFKHNFSCMKNENMSIAFFNIQCTEIFWVFFKCNRILDLLRVGQYWQRYFDTLNGL